MDWWYKIMKDYGMDHDDWYCPTDLRFRAKEKNPDKAAEKDESESKGELESPSYIPAKFSHGFYAPFENPNQPWAVERGGHDEGMHKLLPNGTVQTEFNFKAVRGMRGGGGKK